MDKWGDVYEIDIGKQDRRGWERRKQTSKTE